MGAGFQLHCHKPTWQRGHLRVHAQARFDGVLHAADTFNPDDANARRRFVQRVRAALGDRALDAAELERRLLVVLHEEANPEDEAGADAVEGEEAEDRYPSQADRLVKIADEAELFHDGAGDTYAQLEIDGHRETWPTRSKGFRRWLAHTFYRRHAKAPNAQALADALNVVEAKAQFQGQCEPVYVRVAPDGVGGLYVDLADAQWRAVHVTPVGWRVVHDQPARFRRPAGMLPLPLPKAGGHLEDLRSFVNAADEAVWALIKAWLIAAVRDRGPYPVLALNGEQGTAKTSTARALIALVDPSTPELRSDPREPRDLAIAARNNWVVAFDNVSHLPSWLSDALCRLATGGGFATRELRTDVDEVLFEAQRPTLLTGITDFIARGDLLDRSLQLVLPPILGRRTEKVLWAEFEAARPRLLGALLDAVAGALRELPNVGLEDPPRMADFAEWAVAAEWGAASAGGADGADGPATARSADGGVSDSPFLRAYAGTRATGWQQAIDGSAIGAAVLAFVARDLGAGPWEGTAATLLERLNELADEATKRGKFWPKTPRGLSGELRRLAPALRGVGLEVELDRREGHDRRRAIRLAKRPPPEAGPDGPSAPSAPSSESRQGRAPTGKTDGDGSPAGGPSGPPIGATDPADGAGAADAPSPCRSGATVGTPPNVLVATPVELHAAVQDLASAAVIGVDCETTGLDPRADRVRLIQLATREKVYLVDCFQVDTGPLAAVLTGGPRFVGHNLKFDLQFLAALGLPAPDGCRLFDTMVAAQLLGAGTEDGRLDRCGLAAVAGGALGVVLAKGEQRSDWSGPLTKEQLAYAATDAYVPLPLAEALKAELERAGLSRAAGIEMRALPAIAALERAGAPFDAGAWRHLSDRAVARLVELERALAEEAGDATVNWASPKQVLTLLRARGLGLTDTREATLSSWAANDPVVRLVLEYRNASKRASTYGIDFLKHVHRATGRIHPNPSRSGRPAAGWPAAGRTCRTSRAIPRIAPASVLPRVASSSRPTTPRSSCGSPPS